MIKKQTPGKDLVFSNIRHKESTSQQRRDHASRDEQQLSNKSLALKTGTNKEKIQKHKLHQSQRTVGKKTFE